MGVVNKNEFLKLLGIEHPIIQGPMGGGPSTPELVAAVSNAGGMGSLGAAYQTPDQIAETIKRIRSLTSRPFNVNLFAGGWSTRQDFDHGPMLDLLSEVHGKLGLPAPAAPKPAPDPFPAQLEVVLDARPAVFSFTFGIPDPRCHVAAQSARHPDLGHGHHGGRGAALGTSGRGCGRRAGIRSRRASRDISGPLAYVRIVDGPDAGTGSRHRERG